MIKSITLIQFSGSEPLSAKSRNTNPDMVAFSKKDESLLSHYYILLQSVSLTNI